MKNLKWENKSPFVLFLPFLFFYIVFVLMFQSDLLEGDESRYIYFAQNLCHGFYSPPSPAINLWNGPGYPMFIMPFIALKLPLISIVLMNTVLYYFSIVLLYKTLQIFVSFRIAIICCLFWGLYYNAYQDMILITTEILTSFLTTLLLFFLVKSFKSGDSRFKNIVGAGVTFGYLVITKVLFAYVLVLLLVFVGIAYLIKRNNEKYKKAVVIMLIAFAFVTPYLVYTYSLTGKIFYLGNSGGMSLYWMSSQSEEEYGDWFAESNFDTSHLNNPAITVIDFERLSTKTNNLPIYQERIRANHFHEFAEIFKYEGVKKDEMYKKIAIKNIKENPGKFLQNWSCNIGRLFFSYPFSYTIQSNRTLFRLPMSGLLFVMMFFCIIPTLKKWRKIPASLQIMLIFLLLYLGGTSFLSAYTRMFTVIVPMVLFWIAFVFNNTIKIKLNFE